jgi:hypothetical protein
MFGDFVFEVIHLQYPFYIVSMVGNYSSPNSDVYMEVITGLARLSSLVATAVILENLERSNLVKVGVTG